MDWVKERLTEASSWNAIATALAGMGAYLGTNGYHPSSVWVAAIGAGASAVAGFIIKEAKHP
jgi:hypothetical protein